MISVAISTHYFFGEDRRTAQLEEMLRKFPIWAFPSSWVSTYDMYRYWGHRYWNRGAATAHWDSSENESAALYTNTRAACRPASERDLHHCVGGLSGWLSSISAQATTSLVLFTGLVKQRSLNFDFSSFFFFVLSCAFDFHTLTLLPSRFVPLTRKRWFTSHV